jgi:hypothetical protein
MRPDPRPVQAGPAVGEGIATGSAAASLREAHRAAPALRPRRAPCIRGCSAGAPSVSMGSTKPDFGRSKSAGSSRHRRCRAAAASCRGAKRRRGRCRRPSRQDVVEQGHPHLQADGHAGGVGVRSRRSPMKLDSSSTETAWRASLPSMRWRHASATSLGRPCSLPQLRLPDGAVGQDGLGLPGEERVGHLVEPRASWAARKRSATLPQRVCRGATLRRSQDSPLARRAPRVTRNVEGAAGDGALVRKRQPRPRAEHPGDVTKLG